MANLVEQSAQMIADALAPSPSIPGARWRWGTVESVGVDGTMTVSIGGATVPGIRAAQHVMGAQVGDRVRVLYLGTEAMVDAVRASAKLMSLPTISSAIVLKDERLDRDGTAPSSNVYSRIVGIQDKDGDNVAYLQASQLTDGTVRSGLLAAGEDGNGNAVYNGIYATVSPTGEGGYAVSNPQAFREAIGGVHSQGVIDSWYWVKFTSGMAICEYEGASLTRNITSTSGSIYWGQTGSFPDFPVEFLYVPTINCMLSGSGNCWCWTGGQSKTNVGTMYFGRGTSSSFTAAVKLVAIGRWK